MMLMLMRCLRCYCYRLMLVYHDADMIWINMCCICCCWSLLRCKCRSKSRSYKMFMKFLRYKMLSPCILIYRWGLMPWSFCSTTTVEILLNHDDGAFAQPRRWELMLNHDDEGLCPRVVPHAFAFHDDSRWFKTLRVA